MHLAYYTNAGHLHYLAVWLSWVVVVGAGYGFVRLVWDVLRVIGRVVPGPGRPSATAPTPTSAPTAPSDGEIPPALGHEFPHGR